MLRKDAGVMSTESDRPWSPSKLVYSRNSTLEEWISNKIKQGDTSGDDPTDDVLARLAQMTS